MTYGAIFRNDDQIIQIDDKYVNQYLVATGSSQGAVRLDWPSGVDLTAGAPSILVRPKNGSNVGGIVINPSWFAISSNGSFDWAVLATTGMPLLYSGSYGMRIRTPGGAVAFDSRRKYPRIKTVATFSGGSSARWPMTVNHSVGANAWILANNLLTMNWGGDDGFDYGWSLGASLTSDQVTVKLLESDMATAVTHGLDIVPDPVGEGKFYLPILENFT